MVSRRTFIKQAAVCTAGLSLHNQLLAGVKFTDHHLSKPKLSLAQWSLHRSFENKELDAIDFPLIARDTFGLQAVEYVNGFYEKYGESEKYWSQMRRRAEDAGVKSLLIMVDNEGDLGDKKEIRRKEAVTNHFKWIHAAKQLGCHSIRVNAFGNGTREELGAALVDGLGQLTDYASGEDVHVLLENHGRHTSDADFMISIIEEVDNPYLGTLPDFGNWCLNKDWGSLKGNECTEAYDPLKGVSRFLPYARGVSAKSYDFDKDGNETLLNYQELIKTVKESGFDGYIGIEYEGDRLSEAEGILATRALLERCWAS